MAKVQHDTLTPQSVRGILEQALCVGSKVSNALEKLENYANLFKLNKITRHEAIIALHGNIPNSNYDLSEIERQLDYLLAGSERARELVEHKSSTGSTKNNAHFLAEALQFFFKDKDLLSDFSWLDLKRILTNEFKKSEEELTSLHNTFNNAKWSKDIKIKVNNTERHNTRWKLSDTMRTLLRQQLGV